MQPSPSVGAGGRLIQNLTVPIQQADGDPLHGHGALQRMREHLNAVAILPTHQADVTDDKPIGAVSTTVLPRFTQHGNV